MPKKGVPAKDGRGKGVRSVKGRGGCPPSKQPRTGKGRNK